MPTVPLIALLLRESRAHGGRRPRIAHFTAQTAEDGERITFTWHVFSVLVARNLA